MNPYKILQSKKLQDFVNELNLRFRYCLYNGICRFAPTGEEYITFSPDAITKEYVIDEYKRVIKEYTDRKRSTDTIYWRKYPELRKWPQGFNIYSRLLISNVAPSTDLITGRATMQQYLEKSPNYAGVA